MNNESKDMERKKSLEAAAEAGRLFCDYHEYLLRKKDITLRSCYMGHGGDSSCQYVSWLFKRKGK